MQRDSRGLDLFLPRGHADPELSQARAVCPAQNEKNGQFWGKTAQEWARVWISRVRLTPLSPAFSHTVGRAEFNHQFLLSKGVFSIPSSSNLAVSSLKTDAARLGAASPPSAPLRHSNSLHTLHRRLRDLWSLGAIDISDLPADVARDAPPGNRCRYLITPYPPLDSRCVSKQRWGRDERHSWKGFA